MNRRRFLGCTTALGVYTSLPFTLHAGEAPKKLPHRMRFFVPSPVGSGPDLVARAVAEELHEMADLQVAIVNIEGANGEVARSRFLSERADGATWLFAQDSVLALNPSFYSRDHADPLWGLTPVARVGTNFFYLLVEAGDAIRDFEEWARVAREADSPMNYGSGGVGSQHHLFMEDLASRLDLNLNHVPYRGNRPATQGLLRGDIRVLMAGASSLSLVRAGKLRQIAVTSPEASPDFPGVPAVSEFVDDFSATAWFGLFGHEDVDPGQAAELQQLLRQALSNEALERRLKERGNVTAAFADGDDLRKQVLSDRAMFAEIAAPYAD